MKNYLIILIILISTTQLFSQSADILLNGTVSAENNQIKNVAEPTDGADAVNKDYLLQVLDTTNISGNLQSVLDIGSFAELILNSENLYGIELNLTGGDDPELRYNGIRSVISGTDGRNTAVYGESSGESLLRNYGVWGVGTGGQFLNTGTLGTSNGTTGVYNYGVWGIARNASAESVGVVGYAGGVDPTGLGARRGVSGTAIEPFAGINYGVTGIASGSTQFNIAGGFYAEGGEDTGVVNLFNIGVEAKASSPNSEGSNRGVYATAGFAKWNTAIDAQAESSDFANSSSYGLDVRAVGNNAQSYNVGVQSWANGSGSKYGVVSYASGSEINYGIYSRAWGGTTNYAGYFEGDVKVTSGKIDSDVTLVNPPTEDMDAVNKGYLMELLSSYQSQIDNLQAQINASNSGVIPSNVPLDGLYAYYPFNGDADDAIGDNFGTVMGNASLTSDRFGTDNKAYSFDGSDDYISLHEPWFDGNPSVSAFTYSTWIYVDGYPNQQSSINTKEGYWRTVGIQLGTSGQIVFGGSQPSPNAYHDWSTSSSAITVGQWNHIAVTFTNSNLRIYINGQLSVDETASISNWTFTWSDEGNSTNTNLIGAVAPASGVTKFFSGKIDDFAMWSRALTANEVAELYDL